MIFTFRSVLRVLNGGTISGVEAPLDTTSLVERRSGLPIVHERGAGRRGDRGGRGCGQGYCLLTHMGVLRERRTKQTASR